MSNDYTGLTIEYAWTFLIKGKMALRYKTSATVAREVVSFDRDAGFENGTYHLRAPGKHERLGHETKGEGHGPQPLHGHKKPKHVTTNVRTWLGREGD